VLGACVSVVICSVFEVDVLGVYIVILEVVPAMFMSEVTVVSLIGVGSGDGEVSGFSMTLSLFKVVSLSLCIDCLLKLLPPCFGGLGLTGNAVELDDSIVVVSVSNIGSVVSSVVVTMVVLPAVDTSGSGSGSSVVLVSGGRDVFGFRFLGLTRSLKLVDSDSFRALVGRLLKA
jgi:hypothetical protein